jgi:UDP-glucose 4-epimerase
VGDVVEALIQIIRHPKAWGEVFNVGHTSEISILELANMVKQMTNSDSEIVFVPYDEAYEAGFEDMQRRLPDLTRIQEFIGYKPSLDLPDMLERIIAYYRTVQTRPDAVTGDAPPR